jgi:hypothetical protein
VIPDKGPNELVFVLELRRGQDVHIERVSEQLPAVRRQRAKLLFEFQRKRSIIGLCGDDESLSNLPEMVSGPYCLRGPHEAKILNEAAINKVFDRVVEERGLFR